MSNKGWKPGFTTGISEGRWTPVNEDKRMRYEKANPQHYETPDSEAFVSAEIWKTCGVCGEKRMGQDSLDEHLREKHSMHTRGDGAYLMPFDGTTEPWRKGHADDCPGDMSFSGCRCGLRNSEASCPTPSTNS